MTKIDPTPLIAEAQARETALKVAMRKLEISNGLHRVWFCAGFLGGFGWTWWMLA